jgi:hypothetical protein
MDRKTIVASMDILSQQFTDENDPMAKDLRTMAFCVAKLPEEEYTARLASEDVEAKKKMEMEKCPKCGTKVLKQTGYCLKCKKKTLKASEEVVSEEPVEASEEVLDGMWSKEAAEAVQDALISDVLGGDAGDPAEDAPVPVMDAPAEEPAEEAPKTKKEKAPAEEAPKTKKERAPEDIPVEKTAAINRALVKKFLEGIAKMSLEDRKKIDQLVRSESSKTKTSQIEIVASEDVTSGVITDAIRKNVAHFIIAIALALGMAPATVSAQIASENPIVVIDSIGGKIDDPALKSLEVTLKSRGHTNVQEMSNTIRDLNPEDITPQSVKDIKPGKTPKTVTLNAPEEKNAEQVVDTNILAYEGIELSTPMMDEVSLTADEKSRLDQLFM